MQRLSVTLFACVMLLSCSAACAADRQMMAQPESAPAKAPQAAGIPIPIPETAQPPTPYPAPEATPIHLPKPAPEPDRRPTPPKAR